MRPGVSPKQDIFALTIVALVKPSQTEPSNTTTLSFTDANWSLSSPVLG